MEGALEAAASTPHCNICLASPRLPAARRRRLEAEVVKHAGARCSLHLASSLLLAGHRSAFACAPICPPYPCKLLLSRQCRCYLITATADQREAKRRSAVQCSGPRACCCCCCCCCYHLSILLPPPCGWALLLFRRLSCCCCAYLLLFICIHTATTAYLGLLLYPLLPIHPNTHTHPPTYTHTHTHTHIHTHTHTHTHHPLLSLQPCAPTKSRDRFHRPRTLHRPSTRQHGAIGPRS